MRLLTVALPPVHTSGQEIPFPPSCHPPSSWLAAVAPPLNQVSDMKKHIGEVEKLYQDIRSLRHDMGNHIQMLEHLVAENHMDDAAEYMEHLKKEWNKISPEIKTGSPVIDVILMEKLREAKEKQIRFISDFHYPKDTKLNAFDLSVILNNALDNRMENVSGENPYISL